MKALIHSLNPGKNLSAAEIDRLLNACPEEKEQLFARARRVREDVYGTQVYIRGLVEISNYCRNDCYYCGIRRSNTHVTRYRLSKEEILASCQQGYQQGFRTFVLQGGEDNRQSAAWVAQVVQAVKAQHPDCALTLSLGERPAADYQRWRHAGADRYLLRQETANAAHYQQLHPAPMTLERRLGCLENLRKLGYQVGGGFMVGSPGQTADTLAQDLAFLQQLQPAMVGIGPYLVQKDTPFAHKTSGSAEDTLVMLAVLRLLLPHVLLPATTALATRAEQGSLQGFWAGANVIMPNLSPPTARENYTLYDNKKSTGTESASHLDLLAQQVKEMGYHLVVDRGDVKQKEEPNRKGTA